MTTRNPNIPESAYVAAANDIAYNPDTGILTWKVSIGRAKSGEEAGTLMSIGYRQIRHHGNQLKSHRLAFFIDRNKLPDQIDHENGIRDDNRSCNLRSATHAENMQNRKRGVNNTSGVIGVGWHKGAEKWNARISKGGRGISLGYFDNKEEAMAVRRSAEVEFFGGYARSAEHR